MEQLNSKSQAYFNHKLRHYTPNELAYIKFPQFEHSVLETQRKLIREIWLRCYQAKDFEGALLALKVLAEIDTIDFPDLERLADIVTVSSNPKQILSVLSSKTFNLGPQRSHLSIRSAMLGLFAQSLLGSESIVVERKMQDFLVHNTASDDSKSMARKLFKDNRSDTAFTCSQILMAFDSIIACQQVYDLSLAIVEELDLDMKLPSLIEVLEDPLNMYYSIKLLQQVANGSTESRYLTTKKHELNSTLKDLLMSFALSTKQVECYLWLDFQALYIAYLLAVGKVVDVRERLTVIFNFLQERWQLAKTSVEQQSELVQYESILLKFYEFLGRLIIKFEGSMDQNLIFSIATCVAIMKIEHSKALGINQEESVYLAWLLLGADLASKEVLIDCVADLIERSGTQGSCLLTQYPLARIDGKVSKPRKKSAEVIEGEDKEQASDDEDTGDGELTLPKTTKSSKQSGKKKETKENNKDFKILEAYASSPHASSHWLLWKLLAILLGPLPRTAADDEAVAFNAEIGDYLIPIVIAKEQYVKLGESSKTTDMLNHNSSNEAIAEAVEEASKPELVSTHSSFHEDRQWWTESILSGSQLDEFANSVLSFEVDEILKQFPLFESEVVEVMSQMDLQFLYQERLFAQLDALYQVKDDIEIVAEIHHEQDEGEGREVFANHDTSDQQKFSLLHRMINHTESMTSSPNGYQWNHIKNYDESTAIHDFPLETKEIMALMMNHNQQRTINPIQDMTDRLIDADEEDFRIRRISNPAKTYLDRDEVCRIYNLTESVYLLGGKLLETFTYQALVAAHLSSQDCFFTIRVVQALVQHVLIPHENTSTALKCLTYLHLHGLNIKRAIRVGCECAFRNIEMSSPAPSVFRMPTDDFIVSGYPRGHYHPIKVADYIDSKKIQSNAVP